MSKPGFGRRALAVLGLLLLGASAALRRALPGYGPRPAAAPEPALGEGARP